jgi:hypothetical protein
MVGLRSALKAFNNAVDANLTEDDDPKVCPVCEKRFKTAGGMSSHLRTARRCSWYKKGKLKALSMPGQFSDDIISEEVIESLPRELLMHSGAEPDPSSIMQDHDDLLFELLPSLEDREDDEKEEDDDDNDDEDNDNHDDDERVEEEYVTAGASLRVDDTLHDRWKRDFGPSYDSQGDAHMSDASTSTSDKDVNRFSPFASELDWQIGRWAIQDGIGHKSFDRLMSIPGVSG